MIFCVRLKQGTSLEQVIFLLSEIASFAGDDSTIRVQAEHLSVHLAIAHVTSDEQEQRTVLSHLEGTVSSLLCVEKAYSLTNGAKEEEEERE